MYIISPWNSPEVTWAFGETAADGSQHRGTDFRAWYRQFRCGLSGRAYTHYQEGGFGHYVVVVPEGSITLHKRDGTAIRANAVTLWYAHLSDAGAYDGHHVSAGQIIGTTGASGHCIGGAAHLHLELRIQGVPVDPTEFMEDPKVKNAPHTQIGVSGMEEYCTALKCWYGKVMDPDRFGGLRSPYLREQLGRLYFDHEADKELIHQGASGGREYVRTWCLPRWQAAWDHGVPCTWWELWNEPAVSNSTERTNLVYATLGAMEEANRVAPQVKLCVGNFSVGNPPGEPAEFEQAMRELQPMFDAAISMGHTMGYHSYWAPSVSVDNRWWPMRYQLMAETLAALGTQIPQGFWVLNEAGIDMGILGQANQGWKAVCSRSEYWQQCKAFDAIISMDPTVLMWTPFTINPESTWESFDYDATLRYWTVQWSASHPWESVPIHAGTGGSPAPSPVDLLEWFRNVAWNSLKGTYPDTGVPYTPSHAFPRIAREMDLGAPMVPGDTFDVQTDTGQWYRMQTFARGFLVAPITGPGGDCLGDWFEMTQVFSW